jgi:hypothetical protein
MRKQMMLTAFLCAIAGSANAAQAVDIYVGDSGGEPAGWTGPTYACWSQGDAKYVDRIAASYCVRNTSTGKVQGDFRWQVKSNRAYGKCGATVYSVECL